MYNFYSIFNIYQLRVIWHYPLILSCFCLKRMDITLYIVLVYIGNHIHEMLMVLKSPGLTWFISELLECAPSPYALTAYSRTVHVLDVIAGSVWRCRSPDVFKHHWYKLNSSYLLSCYLVKLEVNVLWCTILLYYSLTINNVDKWITFCGRQKGHSRIICSEDDNLDQ